MIFPLYQFTEINTRQDESFVSIFDFTVSLRFKIKNINGSKCCVWYISSTN